MRFKVKKLTPTAIPFARSEPGAAGHDIYSDEDITILPGERKLISTGISMVINCGFYGHICDRSGMAYKHGAHVMAGTIDESYRGEIKVVLLNTDKEKSIEIKRGDRVAQMIFKRYYAPDFELVNELEQTERGEKGFGSSGK